MHSFSSLELRAVSVVGRGSTDRRLRQEGISRHDGEDRVHVGPRRALRDLLHIAADGVNPEPR